MASRPIVFGPTGNVGSFAARTAHEYGLKVYLAMRDTSKPIPGLSSEEEKHGDYERVQADLTDPATIASAIKQSQATSAFIYVRDPTDYMRAALNAMKTAGVRFIVFLSSFTVNRDLGSIPPDDKIPYIHARVEMNLEEIYGHQNYVALRAGSFATNTLRWRAGIQAGELELESPNTVFDYITPDDMGKVAGAFLAKGQTENEHIVYLYGPQLMAQKDAFVVAVESLGKEVKSEGSSPRTGSQCVTVKLGDEEKRGGWYSRAYSNYNECVGNIEKYTGQPARGYKTWVDENKARFSTL